MHFECSTKEKGNLLTHEQMFSDDTECAQDIVRDNDFTEAFRLLENEHTLDTHVLHTKETYGPSLETADFLTERDWELLTYISLYSPELAVHSIETYQLVRSKIEHILLGSLTISQAITDEHISLNEFYRACLFHDIGKTTIPEFVLNHALVPGDWHALSKALLTELPNEKALEHFGLLTSDLENNTAVTLLTDKQIDPVKTLPVSVFFSDEELQTLSARGISTDSTLREILELHELASQKILVNEGLFTEAQIASQHHNYRKEKYHFPISSQTIGVGADLADLLRLADEEQALRSKRPYKHAFSRTTVLNLLIKDSQNGAINKELTALWVQHDLETNPIELKTPDDEQNMAEINDFIEKYCPKNKVITSKE